MTDNKGNLIAAIKEANEKIEKLKREQFAEALYEFSKTHPREETLELLKKLGIDLESEQFCLKAAFEPMNEDELFKQQIMQARFGLNVCDPYCFVTIKE